MAAYARRTASSPAAASRAVPLSLSSSSFRNSHDQSTSKSLVVVIAGSTGVGKSDVAATLCHSLGPGGAAIVSADSVQAYRHVQIGANKPSAEERRRAPHLLLDVADADEPYNAAEWMRDATYAIERLSRAESLSDHDMSTGETLATNAIGTNRRREIDCEIQQIKGSKLTVVPLVVGGTMMYLQWLLYGMPDAPSPTPAAVARAQEALGPYEHRKDWTGVLQSTRSLHPRLGAAIDKLSPNDWYRLRRILEVAFTVQTNDSSNAVNFDKLYSGARTGGLLPDGYDVRCFFLCPHDRMLHTRNVDERCEMMLLRGLIQETCDLALSKKLPDMAAKAIGYRQVLDYLGREGAKDNDYDAFLRFLEEFTAATRQYSRRQVQWFRKDNQFIFVSVDLTKDKNDRVSVTAREIERMLAYSREDYDKERFAESGSSKETRRLNEKQAKSMKTYMFRHQILKPGSPELRHVLKQADECTHRFQTKRARTD